jgi:hypothetical protein
LNFDISDEIRLKLIDDNNFDTCVNESIEKAQLSVVNPNESIFRSLISGIFVNSLNLPNSFYWIWQETTIMIDKDKKDEDQMYGRVDHLFVPKDNVKTDVRCVIHEYKMAEREDLMTRKAEEALWQLFQKNYIIGSFIADQLNKNNKVIIRGISFAYIVNHGWKARIISCSFSKEEVDNILSYYRTNKISEKRNDEIKKFERELLEKEKVKDIQEFLNKISLKK